MSLSQEQYLFEHWKFNVDQRLKTFNFFVAFSIFANGGVFTAFERCTHPVVLLLLGGFVVILALVFGMMDARCRALLRLIKRGLMDYEQNLPVHCRPFETDRARRNPLVRFTVAFNALFALQCLFGLITVAYALAAWATGGHGFPWPDWPLACA
ncbi:MAG TPA: hypothetical protein H9903_01140 [Candidatus Aquabacterium excrementipullorum]|nr:hypothetical protein [Candidatus Aquabacterium excrementipullorum]